jgi:hypothetical protein
MCGVLPMVSRIVWAFMAVSDLKGRFHGAQCAASDILGALCASKDFMKDRA